MRNGLRTTRLSGLPDRKYLDGAVPLDQAVGEGLKPEEGFRDRRRIYIDDRLPVGPIPEFARVFDWLILPAAAAIFWLLAADHIAFVVSATFFWQYSKWIARLEGSPITRFQSKSSVNPKGIVTLLGFLQMIAPAFASDGAVNLIISSDTTWPSSEKPSTLVACIILIIINVCTRVWPSQFKNSVMAWFLLCFSTLAMWCVIPDIIASKTLLLWY